jgi:hypothetical protein
MRLSYQARAKKRRQELRAAFALTPQHRHRTKFSVAIAGGILSTTAWNAECVVAARVSPGERLSFGPGVFDSKLTCSTPSLYRS